MQLTSENITSGEHNALLINHSVLKRVQNKRYN